MHPDIFDIGFLHFRFYGLALTLSFIIGTHIAARRARKMKISEEFMVWLAVVSLVLAVVGSRTHYVLTHLNEFRGDFAGVFMIWSGGLSMYGGVIAAVLGGIAFTRFKGYPVWKVTDAVAPSLALGEAITRIGCFMNGCCFGSPTCAPWGVVFPYDSFATQAFGAMIRVHPSQIYLSGLAVAVFLFLLWFDKRKSYGGQLFWLCLVLLAVARALVDFTRYYSGADYLGHLGPLRFNNNQLIALVFVVVSIVMMRILRARARKA